MRTRGTKFFSPSNFVEGRKIVVKSNIRRKIAWNSLLTIISVCAVFYCFINSFLEATKILVIFWPVIAEKVKEVWFASNKYVLHTYQLFIFLHLKSAELLLCRLWFSDFFSHLKVWDTWPYKFTAWLDFYPLNGRAMYTFSIVENKSSWSLCSFATKQTQTQSIDLFQSLFKFLSIRRKKIFKPCADRLEHLLLGKQNTRFVK